MVQAIVAQDIIWTHTMEVAAVDTQVQKVNIMVGCNRWEDRATMDHRAVALKILEDMDGEAPDRVILTSIKTFLTEVESIWEATTHLRLEEVDQEVMELVNLEALVTNLLLLILRVSTMVVTVLLVEQGQLELLISATTSRIR